MNRRALVLIAVALALLAIASTIRSGWLYIVASCLFALVVYGLISGYVDSRNLAVSREVPEEVFEKQPFKGRITVRNKGRLNRYLCEATDMQFEQVKGRGVLDEMRRRRADRTAQLKSGPGDEGEVRGKTEASLCIEKLPAHGEVSAGYVLKAPGRGRFERATIRVRCSGVFGVSSVRRNFEVSSPVLALPALSRLERFPFVPVATASPVETFEWERKGPGHDYYGVREYVSGDSLRHIHWPSSARTGTLIVKEYQQEYMPAAGVLLIVARPASGTRYENSLEDSIRATASVVAYYSESGMVPRLFAAETGGVKELEGGVLSSCLRSLALFSPSFEGGGAAALEATERAGAMLPGGSGLAVVTNLAPSDVKYLLDSDAARGISLAAALDETYARGRASDPGETVEILASTAAANGVNLYVLRGDRDIGECLREPLTTTGD